MTLAFVMAHGIFWQLLFWLLMALWLIFGFVTYWPIAGTPAGYRPFGNHLLLWVLLAILGYFAIGFPG